MARGKRRTWSGLVFGFKRPQAIGAVALVGATALLLYALRTHLLYLDLIITLYVAALVSALAFGIRAGATVVFLTPAAFLILVVIIGAPGYKGSELSAALRAGALFALGALALYAVPRKIDDLEEKAQTEAEL